MSMDQAFPQPLDNGSSQGFVGSKGKPILHTGYLSLWEWATGLKMIVHEHHSCYLVRSAVVWSLSRVHLVSVGARLELNEDMIGTTNPASFRSLSVALLPAILLGVQDCSDLLSNWGRRYGFRGSCLVFPPVMLFTSQTRVSILGLFQLPSITMPAMCTQGLWTRL